MRYTIEPCTEYGAVVDRLTVSSPTPRQAALIGFASLPQPDKRLVNDIFVTDDQHTYHFPLLGIALPEKKEGWLVAETYSPSHRDLRTNPTKTRSS